MCSGSNDERGAPRLGYPQPKDLLVERTLAKSRLPSAHQRLASKRRSAPLGVRFDGLESGVLVAVVVANKA